MPSAWAASSASAIWMPKSSTVSVSSGLPGDAVLERLAIQKLHGDERLAVVLADLVDRADVRMVQRRRGTRFAPEAFQRLRVAGHFLGQELQGHEAAKVGVLGLVDHTHPAAAELLDDAVMRDGLADHEDQRPESSSGAGC